MGQLRLGIGLGLGARRRSSTPWTPANLGASFLGMYDAERSDTYTLVSGACSSWTSTAADGAVAQGTAANRPLYSATGLNGRPCFIFDGVNDALSTVSPPAWLLSVATPGEIWALVSQDALPADTTVRVAVAHGDSAGIRIRDLRRTVNTGVNRAASRVGDTSSANTAENLNVDFSGVQIVRMIIGATAHSAEVGGVAGATAAKVPDTSNNRLNFGSSTSGGSLWNGKINCVVFTTALTSDQATAMYAFMNARKGS